MLALGTSAIEFSHQIRVPILALALPPVLIFILCAAAAVGTILLLPGEREASMRKIGAVILLAAAIIFASLLLKLAAGMGAYFWIFSAIAILSALRVITHPRPVYSALYFVLTVMASAGLFVLMYAEFMAAALVLIYAGAILVTYVFVIMLASDASRGSGATPMHEQLAEHDAISRDPVIASAVGFALLGVLLFVIFDRSEGLKLTREDASDTAAVLASATTVETATSSGFQPRGGTQKLGAYLFNKQLINLELAGLILTVAMVGAIVIARKRVVTSHAGAPEMLTAPMTPIDDNPHSIPVVGTDNPRQKEYPET